MASGSKRKLRHSQTRVCKLENSQVNFQVDTFYYIKNCLNPNQEWNKNYPWKKRVDLIMNADVNWTAIEDHIKGMDYQDFLATPYWKAIAAHTKYKAGYRCQVCNSGAYLNTHHRNYDIHGREHDNINELIVLCNKCHQKFHGDERKIARSGVAASIFLGVILVLIIFYLSHGS